MLQTLLRNYIYIDIDYEKGDCVCNMIGVNQIFPRCLQASHIALGPVVGVIQTFGNMAEKTEQDLISVIMPFTFFICK